MRLKGFGLSSCPTVDVFTLTAPPSIALDAFAVRLVKYAACDPAAFPYALCLLRRAVAQPDVHRHGDGALGATCAQCSEAPAPALPLTGLNVHRLLSAALVVAIKFTEDDYKPMSFYAALAGIKTRDMIRLERSLLLLLDHRVYVEPAEFAEVESMMLRGGQHVETCSQ
jgi:hypothetical protein